jgi:6-phosphogluconate dehydrogenase
VLAAALFARFASRQENSPAMQMVAALRGQFGGHAVKMLEDELGEGQVEVHHAAEPKQDDADEARVGAEGEGSDGSADDAGPSSGSGSTGGGSGPTSGSGDTDR